MFKPKNPLALAGKKGKNFKDVAQILQDPSASAKLQNYIDEAVNCKIQIMDKNESIKTLKDSAAEEIGLEPKMFSLLVNVMFNNNFNDKKAEFEKIQEAIEALASHIGVNLTNT